MLILQRKMIITAEIKRLHAVNLLQIHQMQFIKTIFRKFNETSSQFVDPRRQDM
jgi:hypothetical protein